MKPRFTAMGACGSLALLAATQASVAQSWTETTMKPLAATSLDAGGVHVVSYFQPVGGACRLTMMIAGQDADPKGGPTRVQMIVEPGRAAFVDNADGKSSRFTCLYGAEAMNVIRIDRLALSPSR